MCSDTRFKSACWVQGGKWAVAGCDNKSIGQLSVELQLDPVQALMAGLFIYLFILAALEVELRASCLLPLQLLHQPLAGVFRHGHLQSASCKNQR
jgi:hypothetical protein